MADPVLTESFKAQCVFQSQTGLPEDVFINSFYFRNDEIGVSPNGAIKAALDAFYNAPAANGIALSTRLSKIVLPAWKILIYNLGQPPPRDRSELAGVALTRPTGVTAWPAELAVTASFFAGTNRPRNRGRVYLGPWNTSAATTGTADESAVAADLRAAIADRCKMLSTTSQNITWVVLSKADSMAKIVTAGWVDDAFDIQRRRGRKASTRTTWSDV